MSAPAIRLPETGRIPAGWRVIAGKEFTDHLVSLRFLLLLLMIGALGVGTIYTVSGTIRDAAAQATGVRGKISPRFASPPAATAPISLYAK